MSVAHLCVFFDKMSIQILSPFLIGLFGFLLLSCMILFVLVPYQIYDLQLFSLIQWVSLFVVLMVSFTVQKFFSLIPSHSFSLLLFLVSESNNHRQDQYIKELTAYAFFQEFYGIRSYVQVFNPCLVQFLCIM